MAATEVARRTQPDKRHSHTKCVVVDDVVLVVNKSEYGNSRLLRVPTIQMHTRNTINSICLASRWICWCLFLGIKIWVKPKCKRLRAYVECTQQNHISSTRKRSGHNSVCIVCWCAHPCSRICLTNLQDFPMKMYVNSWLYVASLAYSFSFMWQTQNKTRKCIDYSIVNIRKLIFRIFSVCNLFINCIFSAQIQIHFSCIFIARVENIACYLTRREHTNHSSSFFFHILYHSCFISVVSIQTWSWQFALTHSPNETITRLIFTFLRFLSLKIHLPMWVRVCVCVPRPQLNELNHEKKKTECRKI